MTESPFLQARRAPCQRRVVVVANGSSVDAMPPAFWRACRREDVLLVGTNRVLCFASLQGLAWDALVIRDAYRSLWQDPSWGAKYHQELWKPAAAWKVGPADRRITHCDEFIRQAHGWQFEWVTDHNHEAAVMENRSVALMAANWAWLQGARELLLVGVDYRGPHGRMIEPYRSRSPGWQGQYDQPVPSGVERQFAAARQAVAAGGGTIVNLSPGTRLQAIPEMEWTSCLND